MNKFLIFFLLVLCVESAVLAGLKRWWYSDPAHSNVYEWYREEEPDTSVSSLCVCVRGMRAGGGSDPAHSNVYEWYREEEPDTSVSSLCVCVRYACTRYGWVQVWWGW